MSWTYSLERATTYNARDQRLMRHLLAEGCSVTEMFNIGLAHAMDNRYSEELLVLHQTASAGFLPAQALYPSLENNILAGMTSAPSPSRLECTEWVYQAAASGFLFADVAGLGTELLSRARQEFRERGGYNTHYCGADNQDQDSSGLVGSLEIDLHDSPLHLAAAFDDIVTSQGVSSLLSSRINLNSHDHWQDTALMKCCMAGHLASMRALIKHGAIASVTNPINGLSPLHWLFTFEETEIPEAISLLTDGGADPRSPSTALAVKAFHFPFGWPSGTPLHWAVFARNETAVRALLDHGADIFEVDAVGQDSLKIAMKMLDVDLVRVLLSYRGSSSRPDPLSSFSIACERDAYTSPIFKAEHAADENRSAVHDFMWEPLIVGTDPEFDDWESEEVALPHDHYTAVFSGSHRIERCIELLQILQRHYPTFLHWRSQEGFTPLDCALAFANPDPKIVKWMVDGGSPSDARTIYEALMGQYHFTRSRRDLKATYLEIILQTLTREAARELVNAPLVDRALETSFVPLQYAMLRGLLRSTEVLLRYGADPCAEREDGESPLSYARYIVDGDVTERNTKIPDARAWPGIAYGTSPINIASVN